MASIATPSKKRSARRCLFGRPDAESTNQWLQESLDKIKADAQDRWGFNFENGVPMAGTSDFEFSPVLESSVPSFYRQKMIASSTTSSPNENHEPISPASSVSDADVSMEFDDQLTPLRKRLRVSDAAKSSDASPKKRHQGKVTDFMTVHKKRLQRSPKTLDIVLPVNRRRSSQV